MLASSFPPWFDSGVFRPMFLANCAVEHGWDVTVITRFRKTPPEARGLELASRLSPQIRVQTYDDTPERPLPYRFAPKIHGGIDSALNALLVADRMVKSSPNALVLATGPEFHTFLAAAMAAVDNDAPLVLDYRDEWTTSPFDFLKPSAFESELEPYCIRSADRIVMTTQSQIDYLASTYPDAVGKRAVLIRNGWDSKCQPQEPGSGSEVHTNGARWKLSYIGTLADYILPGPFLASLGPLLDTRPDLRGSIQVEFIGDRWDPAPAQLQEFRYPGALRLLPPVSKSAAVDAIRKTSALLLLNEPQMHRYIPGKVYDYIAARRPILVYGEGGEIASIVRELNAGVIVPTGDPEALGRAIDSLRRVGRENSDEARRDEWLQQHTRENLSQVFVAMLEDVLTGKLQ